MTAPGANPDPAGEDPAADGAPVSGMPRWVRVALLIVVVLVLLFVAGKIAGVGGDHGPGRHGGDGTPSLVDDDEGRRSLLRPRPSSAGSRP